LFRTNLNLAAWPALIVGYYTALHLIFHSISRYSFQAIPMMMLAGGFLLAAAHDGLKVSTRTAPIRYALGIGCLVLAWVLEAQCFNALINIGLNEAIVGLTLAIRICLIALGLHLLFRPLAEHLQVNRVVTPIVVTSILALVMISNTFARDQWAEFSCRLDTDHMRAGTRIYISHLQPIAPEDQFVIAVDLNSGAGRRNTFTLTIHAKSFELIGGQPPLSKLFYPKPVYRYYGQLIPLGIEEFRQYAFLPIPDSVLISTLTEHGSLDISVAINNEFPEPNNFVTLWGRFSATGDHYIPSWRNTAIERFVHQGDPRIPLPVNYLSDSAISYYIPRTSDFTRDCEDLSPAAGQQTGRYNIFLMQLKPDGQVLVY
jgi:predicted thioesterase